MQHFSMNQPARILSCREIKHTLAGPAKTYSCEVAGSGKGSMIVRHVLDESAQAGCLRLEPGTVSYGFFWEDRPYNLYVWLDRGGSFIGCYFNISDSTVIRKGALEWRDLIVDILVMPSGATHVLDENELPHDLTSELAARIAAAKSNILATSVSTGKFFHLC